MASSIAGINFTLDEDDNLNAEIFQGCDIDFALVELDDTGEPIDVSAYEAVMTLRHRAKSDVIVAEFTVGNGRVIVGSTDGTITFVMSAADCELLEAGTGVYDIRFIDGSGKKWQPQSGSYEIVRACTRD